MPVYPHPQNYEVLEDKRIAPAWHQWFRGVKDHANRGQLPSDILDINAIVEIKLPSQTTGQIVRVQSATAGAITMTANPQIEFGFDGQVVILEGQSDTKTIEITDGNGLKLAGGTNFTLGELDTINLHFNALKNLWVENTRSNN